MSPPVRGFALTGAARACATPEGAYANCLALSARYAAWLRDAGVPAGLLAMRGSRGAFPSAAGRWPGCDPEDYAHWVTFSGEHCVDWTWRQFDREAAWPVVLPVDALAGAWHEVRVWACETCPELVADPLHQALTPAGCTPSIARWPSPRAGRARSRTRATTTTPPLAPMCSCAGGTETSTAAG